MEPFMLVKSSSQIPATLTAGSNPSSLDDALATATGLKRTVPVLIANSE
jgi:hypothetical protein